jgi:ATP-dependent Clp protease ATP-binding subunit ClpX
MTALDLSLHVCSFCHKHKDQVAKLIVSDQVAICNECVSLCQDLLIDEAADKSQIVKSTVTDSDPRKIKQYLDRYVVGQENAKKTLSVAIVNHYKRLRSQDRKITKSNILMIGPTGSGKTLLAQTVAKCLDIPFTIADATSITEAGYVGDDVESLISRLYIAAGNDIEKTQKGIIFIDEIDKIARKSESTSITRDVSGEGVQQALLKLVEGTKCRIPAQASGRKHPSAEMIEIDTTDILFIAGGAFVGLDDIVKKRTQGTSIGFHSTVKSDVSDGLENLSSDDLVRYGLIPEFVGRFSGVVTLEELTRDDLRAVLTQVDDNFIEQYQWLFHQDEIELSIKDSAIDSIVDEAVSSGTGARGLQSQLERVLLPHMFEIVRYKEQGIKCVDISPELVNKPTSIQGE